MIPRSEPWSFHPTLPTFHLSFEEKIFVMGAVATSLYITVTGKFIHVEVT